MTNPLNQDVVTNTTAEQGPGRILVVCDEHAGASRLLEILTGAGHRCRYVGNGGEAIDVLAHDEFDVVVVNPALPDGDGLRIADYLHGAPGQTKVIAVVETGGTARPAVNAMRRGAIDVVALADVETELAERVAAAIDRCRTDRRRAETLRRLHGLCRDLNVAREDIAEQVDLLGHDLAEAYQTIAKQIGDVATSSEFRTLLKQELDVEDLLRTALEYLLTKTGPTNAAVFLPDAESNYGLGAYVNYDCPRESIDLLLDHLCRAICPQMADEPRIVSFQDATEFAEWVGTDADFLADSEIVAYSCRHLGKCLAVIVMFRSRHEPFAADLCAMVDLLRPIFAEQLAQIIKVHHRATPSWPSDAADDEYYNDDCDWGLAA